MKEKLIKTILKSNDLEKYIRKIVRDECPKIIGLKNCRCREEDDCEKCWAEALGVEEDV